MATTGKRSAKGAGSGVQADTKAGKIASHVTAAHLEVKRLLQSSARTHSAGDPLKEGLRKVKKHLDAAIERRKKMAAKLRKAKAHLKSFDTHDI
jgi:hypothetical protein